MSGEGSLPGSQTATFSLCPRRMGVWGEKEGGSKLWPLHSAGGALTEALKAPPPDTITTGIQVPHGFCKVTDTLSTAPSRSEMSVSQMFHRGGAVRVGHPPKSARGQGRCSRGVSLFSCRTAPPGNAGVDGRQADG